MKKEIEVTLPARAAVPVRKTTKEVITCDVCGKTVDSSLDNRYGSGSSKCCLCQRDICRSVCMLREYPDGGDYGENYCIYCHGLRFGKYQKEIDLVERNYEKALENIDKQIVRESLEMKNV